MGDAEIDDDGANEERERDVAPAVARASEALPSCVAVLTRDADWRVLMAANALFGHDEPEALARSLSEWPWRDRRLSEAADEAACVLAQRGPLARALCELLREGDSEYAAVWRALVSGQLACFWRWYCCRRERGHPPALAGPWRRRGRGVRRGDARRDGEESREFGDLAAPSARWREALRDFSRELRSNGVLEPAFEAASKIFADARGSVATVVLDDLERRMRRDYHELSERALPRARARPYERDPEDAASSSADERASSRDDVPTRFLRAATSSATRERRAFENHTDATARELVGLVALESEAALSQLGGFARALLELAEVRTRELVRAGLGDETSSARLCAGMAALGEAVSRNLDALLAKRVPGVGARSF